MIGDDKPSNVQVWDHPYITSVKGVGGWGRKMVNFADLQYCIYADIVVWGWSEKVQKYAGVI